jgi:uncharacterized protein YcfL
MQHKHFPIFLFPVLLLLFALFSLTGCSKDTPQRAVKRELGLIRKLDENTIKAFISYEDMMNSNSSTSDVGTETTNAVKLFFQDFDYKIKSTSINDNKASVHVEITNLDTHALAKDVCLALVQKSTGSSSQQEMSLNSYFALLGDLLSENSYPLVTRPADISLLKTEDGWMIQNTDQLEDDLVSGFISYLKDPYLVTPEEMITVVLEGLMAKSPEEWKTYLNMQDIFSTYSQNYEKTDDALAEQLSRHISYKILSVTEDQEQKSATAKITITSLDMECVLKRYQELLMDYAATTESIRASSSELADETASLLAQALTENEATTDTEVVIHFTNNGSSWEMQLNEDFTNALLGNAGAAIENFQNDSSDTSEGTFETETSP